MGPRAVIKNDLRFLVVMDSGPKTMTMRNPHQFFKILATRHSVKGTHYLLQSEPRPVIVFWMEFQKSLKENTFEFF